NVVSPHLRTEREHPRRDGTADASEPDDADAQLRDRAERAGGPRVPTALAYVPIERDDAPYERKKQRKRVIGDLLRAVVGHAHDRDAVLFRRVDVDVVEANGRRGN